MSEIELVSFTVSNGTNFKMGADLLMDTTNAPCTVSRQSVHVGWGWGGGGVGVGVELSSVGLGGVGCSACQHLAA